MQRIVNDMKLEFMQAEICDAEAIIQMNKELIDKYEDTENIDYDYVMRWVRKNAEQNIKEYMRIVHEGQIAGFVYYYPCEDKMKLDDLFLYPKFQNKGIGTEVIKKFICETDKIIFLYVFIKNERAFSLYRRLGFQVTGKIHNSRYIMERKGEMPVSSGN